MNLPLDLSKEGAAKKKLGQIPAGKKTSKITNAIIDTREPKDTIQKMTFGGVPTLVMALPAGDVMCTCSDGCTVLIERKTPDDFLGTLAKNRLFPQVARMVKRTPWSYIVITGLFYKLRTGKVKAGGRETGWDWTAVQGALLTCQEMGASVVYDSDFEGTVQRLCKRDHRVKPIQPARETALLTEGEQCIAALPGIGHERVQAMAIKLESPAVMLEWLTDLTNPTKIPWIADGTKKRVIKALELDQERLAIVPATCTEQGYTPSGHFFAAADVGTLAWWKRATAHTVDLEGDPENGN